MKPAHKKARTAHLTPHQFKPGNNANPNGRPPITKEQRVIRAVTLESYRAVIELILTGTIDDLKAFAKDPKTPVLQVGVASAILTAIRKGDASVIEQFAARLVGKIPDVIKLESRNQHTHLTDQILNLNEREVSERLKRLSEDI